MIITGAQGCNYVEAPYNKYALGMKMEDTPAGMSSIFTQKNGNYLLPINLLNSSA